MAWDCRRVWISGDWCSVQWWLKEQLHRQQEVGTFPTSASSTFFYRCVYNQFLARISGACLIWAFLEIKDGIHDQFLINFWKKMLSFGFWQGAYMLMAWRSLVLPAYVANRTLPQLTNEWLLPSLSADEKSCSKSNAQAVLKLPPGKQVGHQGDIQTYHPSRWDVHPIEVKYCDEIWLGQQPATCS